MRTNFISPLILVILAWSGTVAYAQKHNLKSVDYKNFEREINSLSLHKRVYTEYNMEGKIVRQESYLRNQMGQLVKQKEEVYKTTDRAAYKTTITYDSLGGPIQRELLESDFKGVKLRAAVTKYNNGLEEHYTSHFKYNKLGKLEEVVTYDPFNKIIGKEKRKYNKAGDELSISSWRYSDAAFLTKNTYNKVTKFDASGYLLLTTIDKVDFSGDGVARTYREMVYFERNQMIKWQKFNNGVLSSTYERGMAGGGRGEGQASEFGDWATDTEFDSLGNKIRTTYTEIDQETGKTIVTQVNDFAYDGNMNLIKTTKTYFEPDGQKSRVEEDVTELDEFNNVIRSATYVDGQLTTENIYAYEYH